MIGIDPLQAVIRSRSPVRISFAGGGTDVSPFPETYGGAVVNATIATFMTAALRLRADRRVVLRTNHRADPVVYESPHQMAFDGRLDFVKPIVAAMYRRDCGFELELHASVPVRSGLGGSGAMCVTVLAAFNHLAGRPLGTAELAELAYHVETDVLGNASGRQDQYAACFGGFNFFEFNGRSRVRVEPLTLDEPRLARLADSLVLLWLGQRPSDSGGIIEEQTRGVIEGGPALTAMHQTRRHVRAMRDALEAPDVRAVGSLLDALWREKKQFSRSITSPRIDRIYDALRSAGMIGGKITGAGGGGHLLACCDQRDRPAVIAAAVAQGVQAVPFAFHIGGVSVWEEPLEAPGRQDLGQYAPVAQPAPAAGGLRPVQK